MINVNNLSVVFSDKKLFENVNLQFTNGNCYGVIGANGAGKSTFLKILAKEFESTTGEVLIEKGKRLSVLEQDHFKYDELSVIETVISGYQELYSIMKEKDSLYQKPDFSEADGIKAAELEEQFADLNGWEAESEVKKLLEGLNLINKNYDATQMKDLEAADKVKVLLARALFGNPDALILDEPTNHLDFKAIKWLEEFLIEFEKTVIVVSHDRHFLNNVCTHIVDIDYQKAKLYVGNYEFWYESSALAQKLMQDQNKKKEEQIKQLEEFVARFSANASKSKQATSRKKVLDKIQLDDIVPSSRKSPYIEIKPQRDIGKEVITVENLTYDDGENKFQNISFNVGGVDKVVFVSKNEMLITNLFDIINGKIKDYSGEVRWGITVEQEYFPKDFNEFFEDEQINLIDWLREFDRKNEGDAFIRGFLGRMLFSKEEPLKKVKILSGGEKMRMIFSKLMMKEPNVMTLEQPTNHLDLESIQAVNEGLARYKGALLFSSHDLSFVESLATKVIELTPNGAIEFNGTFEEFMDNEIIQKKIEELHS
ncbi:MAG: ABC-F family ATP-binding cassette domain-containing protein [Mycoplasmatales bacterium]